MGWGVMVELIYCCRHLGSHDSSCSPCSTSPPALHHSVSQGTSVLFLVFIVKTILSDGEERNIFTRYIRTFDIQEGFLSTIVRRQEYQCDCLTKTVRVTGCLTESQIVSAQMWCFFVVYFLEARAGSKTLYMLNMPCHSLMYVGCQCAGLGFHW